jgi:hypothetical protein
MRKMRVESLAHLLRVAAAIDVPLVTPPDTKVPDTKVSANTIVQ